MTNVVPLARLVGAEVRFRARGGDVRAVRGIDLHINRGEAVGLVGESGSGKSTAALALLRLQPLSNGRVWWRGEDVTELSERQLRGRRRWLQPVMQQARATFNPRLTIGRSIAEPLRAHGLVARGEATSKVAALLEDVGLDPSLADRRPSELSGGQLQRASIARALAVEPELLVLDEPISALDVSVAARVLNLLGRLREERGVAMLFIAHDLHAVAHLCDRAEVMYLGQIVERGPAAEVIDAPMHPYSEALVRSAPRLGATLDLSGDLQGDPPSPQSPPSGCALHPRCPIATADCRDGAPPLAALSSNRHIACWNVPSGQA